MGFRGCGAGLIVQFRTRTHTHITLVTHMPHWIGIEGGASWQTAKLKTWKTLG